MLTPSTQLTLTEQINTLLSARRFGGFFMQRLAEAGLAADADNRAIIFDSFPKLTADYGPDAMLHCTDLA